jgi:hypothetical protein
MSSSGIVADGVSRVGVVRFPNVVASTCYVFVFSSFYSRHVHLDCPSISSRFLSRFLVLSI